MSGDPTIWLLARASGIAAYALLTAVVLLGVLVRARPLGTAIRPATLFDLHRFVAILSLGALSVHGSALLLDRAVDIRVLHLLVPGAAPYRPFWTGAGVLAAELTVLVYASFSQRKRIGTRAWRALHRATYAAFALATLHGLGAGTDSDRPWALVLYGGATGAVLAGWAWRVLVPAGGARRTREASSRAA